MADPEVLARGGEFRGHKGGGVWGEGRAHSPEKMNFKSKNWRIFVHF